MEQIPPFADRAARYSEELKRLGTIARRSAGSPHPRMRNMMSAAWPERGRGVYSGLSDRSQQGILAVQRQWLEY